MKFTGFCIECGEDSKLKEIIITSSGIMEVIMKCGHTLWFELKRWK